MMKISAQPVRLN